MHQAVSVTVPEARRLEMDPERTATLVIDVEQEFMRPRGLRYLGERAERILDPMAELLARARAVQVPVVYVRSVRDPDDPEFTRFGVDEHLMRDSWGVKFCAEIAPVAGDVIVEKQCHDCFRTGDLEKAFDQLSIGPATHTIIVVGVALEICVSLAVCGLSVRNYLVALPMDCTASRTEEAELVAYQRFIHRAYAHNVVLTQSNLIELGDEQAHWAATDG